VINGKLEYDIYTASGHRSAMSESI